MESPLVEYKTLDEDDNTLEDLLKAEKHLGALTIANWKYFATGYVIRDM